MRKMNLAKIAVFSAVLALCGCFVAMESAVAIDLVWNPGANSYWQANGNTLVNNGGGTNWSPWSPGGGWQLDAYSGGSVTGSLAGGAVGNVDIYGGTGNNGTGNNFTLNGDLEVYQYGVITGTNFVSNSADIYGNASVSGSLTVTGINGVLTIRGDAATASGTSITNTAKDITIKDNVVLGSATTVTAGTTLTVDGSTGSSGVTLNNGVSLNSAGNMNVTKAIGSGNNVAMTTSTGSITVDSSTLGTGAKLTSKADLTVRNGTTLDTGSVLKADGAVVISGSTIGDNSSLAGTTGTSSPTSITITNSKVGAQQTWTTSGKVTINWTELTDGSLFTSTGTGGGIEINGDGISKVSTIGAGSKLNANGGNILITGANIKSGSEIITGNAAGGTGNIVVNMTTGNTAIGQNVTIQSKEGGNIFLTGQSSINRLTIDSGSKIITKAGDVRVENVSLASTATITTSGGVDRDNVWDLVGAGNILNGTLQLNGTATAYGTTYGDTVNIGDRAVTGEHSVYTRIDNQTGNAHIIINGGHTGTIINTNANNATNASLYELESHDNLKDNANTQVVQNVTGQIANDVLLVKQGARFTEHAKNVGNTNVAGTGVDRDGATTGNATAQNAQVTSITGMKLVELETGAGLEVGRRDSILTGTKFEATEVILNGDSDLYIHRATSSSATNIHTIGSLTADVGSTLWIDRTNIITASGITMESGSTLIGFVDANAAANITGKLTLESGSTIKPYSLLHENPEFWNNASLTWSNRGSSNLFSDTGVEMKVAGNIDIQSGITMESRLFAAASTHQANVKDGTAIFTNHADYVSGNGIDFIGNLPVASSSGVIIGANTFNPTFGNDNELGAKQEFKLYTGDGTTHDNTYYYSVIRDTTAINGLGTEIGSAITDNTLFNNQIVKSDMLGEWNFEMNDTGTEVLLRFRLLAKHPTQGGIAADMVEPNAHTAARELDRIRYPDDGTGRYNGYMKDTYETLYAQNPGKYSNYKDYYIDDFQDLLLNIQNEIVTGADTNHAIRRLHPEPYADLANINIRTMDLFVRTREQHGISSLFQVENDQYQQAVARIEGNENALASMDSDCAVGTEYVQNPIRFWASAFGSDGNQKKVGTEYGFDSEMWGGAIGMMKEFGNFYFGLSGGYARVSTDWDELSATAKSDAFMADALIGYRIGMGFIEAYGNYAYNEHKTTRDLSFAMYSGVARGEYHDNVYGGGIRVGYQQLICDSWLFIPSIGVNYVKSSSSGFSEDGRYNLFPKLEVASGGIRRQNLRVPISARLSRPFVFMDSVVTPELRASFISTFGDKRAKATARFAGDPSSDGRFTAVGIENGRWASQLGASLEISRYGRLNITANYDYTFAKKSYEHNYSLMVGMNF